MVQPYKSVMEAWSGMHLLTDRTGAPPLSLIAGARQILLIPVVSSQGLREPTRGD